MTAPFNYLYGGWCADGTGLAGGGSTEQTVRKRKFSKNSLHSELRMCKILICRLRMLQNNLINVNDIVGLV